jgi:lipopolysaccharide/colanic/teichoic acid biosynthesis glycosyltransferase
MTSNSRAKAEAKIALSADRSLEAGPGSPAQTRAVPPRGRGSQQISERPASNLSRVEPAHLEREAILTPESRTMRSAYQTAKRGFDLLLGSGLLVISVPIILIAAAAIRIETPGSPFFIQTRLGRDGKPFRIVKLRGMYADARVRFPSYYDYSSKRDLDFCFHHEEDPRVTRAGMFIRKTSIDELPNLWNVVLGDMSLVGPRPEIPEVLALYGPYRQEYLSVKPGVTCLSKCTGRDRLTKRETIDFDIKYIRERSFGLDLTILWRTFRGVVLRRDVF